MPPSSSKWEGECEVEGHGHKVEVGDLLEPSGSLHHHQLVATAVSCHHADLIGAHLKISRTFGGHDDDNVGDDDDKVMRHPNFI